MNDNTTTVVAESSPAQEVIHVEEMNDSQRERWLKDGTHPEIKPKTADPAPAGDKAASPAEGTGKRKTADDRKAQLSAEIQDLLAERKKQREALEKERVERTESQPVEKKVDANAPKPPERPKRPDLVQFKTTAEFEAAMDKYDADVESYSAQKAAFDKATAEAQEAQTKMEQRLKDGIERVNKKYPDAIDVSKPIFQALVENSTAMPQVTWFLNHTEVLPDMLYALGGKFKLDEFIELGKTNPAKAIRVLAMMENDIITELEKSAKAAESAEVEEKPVPREKKVTQAPEPPKEVGGKASASEDPLKSAVARRDFSSFANEANKRDIQRRTRG